MRFEILVNDVFDNLKLENVEGPTDNKSVLGITAVQNK